MKKLICTLALVSGAVPFAQAQVYFNSGSAQPNNPQAAKVAVDHQYARKHKKHVRMFRCADGSRHSANACGRHGGIRR